MSVTFDVSGDSNVNPWTLPTGLSAVKSTAKIVSGSLRPTYTDGPLTLIKVTSPNTSGLLDVIWTTAQDFNNPDACGAAFVNASGDGYFYKFYYDLAYLYAVSGGAVTGGAINTLSGLTYSAGAQFRAVYDLAADEIRLYNQSAPSTVIDTTTGLTPVSGMAAGVGWLWEDSGSAGIVSATLSSASAAAIDSYPATVRSGQTGISYTTTGLSSISGITVGSLAATSLSDTAGDGTHSLPGLVDGVAHQLYGTKTVTITGTGGAPTTETEFLPMDGWDFEPLEGTLNASETGVLHNFSPAAVVPDQIVFDTSKGSVDGQGNFIGYPGPPQTMWHIQASTGIARSYLVVTSLEVSASTNKITGRKITGSRITGSKITGSKI